MSAYQFMIKSGLWKGTMNFLQKIEIELQLLNPPPNLIPSDRQRNNVYDWLVLWNGVYISNYLKYTIWGSERGGMSEKHTDRHLKYCHLTKTVEGNASLYAHRSPFESTILHLIITAASSSEAFVRSKF